MGTETETFHVWKTPQPLTSREDRMYAQIEHPQARESATPSPPPAPSRTQHTSTRARRVPPKPERRTTNGHTKIQRCPTPHRDTPHLGEIRRDSHPRDTAPLCVGRHQGTKPPRLTLQRLPGGLPHRLAQPHRAPQGRVEALGYSTVHKAKGTETDYVIFLDTGPARAGEAAGRMFECCSQRACPAPTEQGTTASRAACGPTRAGAVCSV